MENDQAQRPNVMIAPYSCSTAFKLESSIGGELVERSTHLFMRNANKRAHHLAGAHLNQIKGPSGSVRGHRDVVKKSLENIRQQLGGNGGGGNGRSSFAHLTSFMSPGQQQLLLRQMEEHRANYLERIIDEEQDQCVAYTTTLGVIRRTFEDSKQMKSILNLNLIRYEERDIYLNQEYKNQLRMRCCNLIKVPALFVDGHHVGGLKELELLNESGKLCLLLAKFKMSKAPVDVCLCCGNARYIACQTCNGSRKSAIHHFKFNSIALRCIRCDKNEGLVRCPVCCSTSSSSSSSSSEAFLNSRDLEALEGFRANGKLVEEEEEEEAEYEETRTR